MSQTLLIIILMLLFPMYNIISCIEKQEYIVNTEKCKIPDLEPFNQEVQSIMEPVNYINCNKTELLTYITKVNNSAILHIREDVISNYSPNGVNCCYSDVIREQWSECSDTKINISECKFFQNQVRLIQENIMVKCSWDGNVVYENVHNPIIIKASVREKLNTKNVKGISVLMVVIDSISRLNLIRTMPKTYQFLLDNHFIEMKGYNKIDDNTFPNFLAILAGFNLSQSMKICNPYEHNKLNECPMIWYNYRNLGYVTAYAEDYDTINTFCYGNKKGFIKSPTDYYLKSHVAAAEKLKIVKTSNMPFCTGPVSSGERILNLAKDFIETFRNYSSFGVFWMNTFSHNDINSPSMMDAKMEAFFRDLKESGFFEDRIVIFLSDHGVRSGKIRFTRSGWFEERMPVNMISVPRKFQEQFKTEYENLKKNSNKLTNTYDMYMTLQHILTLSELPYDIQRSAACPKCLSLFQEIPANRSCEDAAIPPWWCTCAGFFLPVDSNHEYVKNATKFCPREKYPRGFNHSVERVISSSISEINTHDGSRYLYIAFRTIESSDFLMTVKFKDFIDNSSIFYVQ